MKKSKLLIPAPLLALGLLLTTSACTAPAPQNASEASGTADQSDSIIGEWTMTTLEFGTGGELQQVPFSGQIIFTDAGTVSVQAMNPDTTAPDTPYTVQGYEAFYGDAAIDADAGRFSVAVESAAARDLIGQTLSRNFEVTDDTLVLTPVDPSEGWRVTYERATD
ncbi:lipocalin-like domain-containing protein [Arthrobacter sp. Alg241-R88]|uniref:lipocalin-like domain-containing protein n=1 Tax=Arthrobacter sp. Alg241-R88 TaxID=2305984 RepID=UPI0013D53F49|nr:lipocalin-like domain-containing protein [Arthrobacter sp. Alg241-R88]